MYLDRLFELRRKKTYAIFRAVLKNVLLYWRYLAFNFRMLHTYMYIHTTLMYEIRCKTEIHRLCNAIVRL